MFQPCDDIRYARDAHGQTRLFQTFARGGFGGVFAAVDKTGGQSPQPAKGFVGAAHKQNATVILDEDSRRNFRVNKINPSALRTNGTLAAEFIFADHLGAATRTKFDVTIS